MGSAVLSSTGNPWSATPGPFDITVPGVDGTNDNKFANLWSNLDFGETNFFPGVGAAGADQTITESTPNGNEAHLVRPAAIPEPASLALLGGGLLALVPLRRWRRRG
jgi:hypothetical protein